MDRFLQKNANDFDFRALEGGGDFAARFLGVVNADALADELAASIAWVRENVPKTPVGTACPLRTPTDIKQLLDKGTEGVLSAGSLSALSLPATALDRGGHVIEREPVCYACGALAQPSPLWRTADRGRFSWWPPRTSSADDGDAADLLLVEVREGDIVTELGYRPGHKYPARIVHRLTSELMEQREVMRRRLARLGTADRASPSSERGQAVDGVDDDRRTSWADDGDPEAWVEVREGDIVTELGYRPGHTYPARIVHPLTSELMMAKAAAAEVARRTSAASPKNKARDLARASWRDLTNKIAESTQLKPKKVAQVFAALRTIAYAEVKKTKKFVIPKLLTLELKHKPARKAGTKVIFGREVKVAAKPVQRRLPGAPRALTNSTDASRNASKVVRALPAKDLKDSI